jgi:hypothetical protein
MTDTDKALRMTETERYRAFRNFMFNELQISKEDIRQWIREAVQQQAETMVKREAERVDLPSIAARQFRLIAEELVKPRGLNKNSPSFLVTTVTAQIMDKIELKLKP